MPNRNIAFSELFPFTRVFWIKIELKERLQRGRQVFGEIKDVLDGRKSPLVDMLDIIYFILPYMEKMGIHVNWFWWLTNRLREKIRRNRSGNSDQIPEDQEH
jgi:hypothetical protein